MEMLLKVNTGRMRQLADFLETVPPEDFNLDNWMTQHPVASIALGPIVLRRGCGFAGCAMGWAAHSGMFEGLRINRHNTLVYRGATDFEAAALFLGITSDFAGFFFIEENYDIDRAIDPADVARRLRVAAGKIEARIARRSGAEWLLRLPTAATTPSIGVKVVAVD